MSNVVTRSLAALAVLGAALPGLSAAQAPTGPSAATPTPKAQPLKPADIFNLTRASDPQVSPDGTQVAYVRVANDIMVDRGVSAIWVVDLKTGVDTPLVSGSLEGFEPRWSPDGTRIAFLASEGEGPPSLYVRWLASGRTARLATLARPPKDISWSPDGRQIAFVMLEPQAEPAFGAPLDKPKGAKWSGPLQVISSVSYRADGVGELEKGRDHVFVISAEGGTARQLTFGDTQDAGPLAWTPDGKAILVTRRSGKAWEINPFRSAVWSVPLAGGAPTRLTQQEGPDGQADVSPDGRAFAFVGYDDHYHGYTNQHVYVADIDGGHVHALAGDLDRSLSHPRWARDGKSIYAEEVNHGVTEVVRLGLDGAVAPVANGLASGGLDLPYSGGAWSVGPRGEIAYTQGSPDRPPELALAQGGADDAHIRRLTDLNGGLFATRTLGRLEALPVKSSFDGLAIDAWMITPPGFDPAKKYPLILEIHGGPFASYGPIFATDDQLYAAAGYVVVYANPRGSTSYGDAFANEIDHAYPGHDYDDLMSVVDAAVAKGFVDPGRLFVTGGSGGGVLTSWIVGKTHRFRAAVAQKPVIDWASEVLTNDLYPWMARYWFGQMPWEDPVHYWARSPLSLVGNVTTPTMIIVGGSDVRTPDEESEQYYGALRLRGVPTVLIKVPGAFHDMALRPSHSAAKAEAVLAWFAQYDAPAAKP
ncbi:MAG: S9 family peptidase [Alphaproteobacteria bacterium]|nr:S9 family peptidase [Alphaproteobacteria bacterium]